MRVLSKACLEKKTPTLTDTRHCGRCIPCRAVVYRYNDRLQFSNADCHALMLPKCPHCTKMAPDWEKLAEEWKDHAVGFVAEVDCTTTGKPLCDANGLRGYPTMKYGDPHDLQDYQGGRHYADLAQFATENLKPVCSVGNIELCDAEKKVHIEKYMKLSVDELNKAVAGEETKLEKAEEDFKAAVEKLQAEYQKLSEDKEDTIAAVKNAGLALMKSVLAAKTKVKVGDEL